MNTEKLAWLLRHDPVPWDDLRERRVLGDLQKHLSAELHGLKVTGGQSLFGDMLPARVVVIAAAALLVCLGAFIGARFFAPPAPAQPSDGQPTATSQASDVTSYSTLLINGLGKARLSPTARMTLERETANEIHLRQSRGRIRYTIQPQREKTLVIHVHAVEVRVIGTAFDINVTGDTVSVEVMKGVVSVTTGAGPLFLSAGERFETRLTDTRHPAKTPDVAPLQPPTPATTEATDTGGTANSESDESMRHDGGKSHMMRPRNIRRYTGDAAVDTLAPPPAPAQMTQVLGEVDSARKSGDYARAEKLLRQAIQTWPADSRVPVCYFTLGNVAFSSGRFLAAARAYRQYLRVAPGGNLSEDALAAIADSLNRAGDPKSAATAARRYLEKHADGIHAQRMKALIK